MMVQQKMDGQVCLITGATSGIGRVTALELARMGAKVIIVGRNPEKTAAVAQEIQEESGGPGVDYVIGDLSSMEEVRRIAEAYQQRYNRLDVLVNNAGALFMSRKESVDGLEMTFALNHLSYFLLTNLLLDLLKASAPSRIIVVSSGAHGGGKINFDDLQLLRGYSGWRAYSQSKLMNVMFAYELSRRLEGTRVTVNALHPGFVATNFGRSNGGIFNWLFRLSQLGALSSEQGAQTTIYLASSPEVQGVSGKYFVKQHAVRSSRASYDEEAARRLWTISQELTGLTERATA